MCALSLAAENNPKTMSINSFDHYRNSDVKLSATGWRGKSIAGDSFPRIKFTCTSWDKGSEPQKKKMLMKMNSQDPTHTAT